MVLRCQYHFLCAALVTIIAAAQKNNMKRRAKLRRPRERGRAVGAQRGFPGHSCAATNNRKIVATR
jgi:hypothetical protein